MSLGVRNTPSVVDDLYALLRSEGFGVVDDRRGGMGGLIVTLDRPVLGSAEYPRAQVQIAADRGQWTVALKFAGMSRFIDPRVWVAHLDAAPIGEPDVGQQAAFVGERLVEAAEAVKANPAIESLLVRLGQDHMRRRLGLDVGDVGRS